MLVDKSEGGAFGRFRISLLHAEKKARRRQDGDHCLGDALLKSLVRLLRDQFSDFHKAIERLVVGGTTKSFADKAFQDFAGILLTFSIAGRRFTMLLLATFAAAALLLAAIGIYGVLSYLVGQRTREIGVRMALGAQRFDVLRMILKDGARMTLVGVGIGLIFSLAAARLMANMLFGVSPNDPVTFIGVAALLCLIALLACYVPARKAMNVDPIITLRYE